MRILILSDIHGNIAALQEVWRRCEKLNPDRVLFLGDVVDYGPHPIACINWLRDHAHLMARGNHDHAVGYDTDCHSAPHRRPLAVETRKWMNNMLDESHIAFLREMPSSSGFSFAGVSFFCCHAAPSDYLYKYLSPQAPDAELAREVERVNADCITVGHTHFPMVKTIGGKILFNPGSVGQPTDGDPRAAYAIWEDGKVDLQRVEYAVERTLEGLLHSPLPRDTVDRLIRILREGR